MSWSGRAAVLQTFRGDNQEDSDLRRGIEAIRNWAADEGGSARTGEEGALSRTVRALLRKALSVSPAGRLARGAFWSLGGATVSRLLTMLVYVFVVRWLGRGRYGELFMVQTTIGLAGALAGAGMGETAVKYLAQFREADPQRACRILALVNIIGGCIAVLMSIACFVFAEPLAVHVLKRADLAPLLRLGSALPMISTLDGIQSSTLAGLEAFKVLAHRSIVCAIISLPLTLPLVYFFGIRGAVIAQVAVAAASLALSWTAARSTLHLRGLRIRFNAEAFSEWRVALSYSLPALVAGVLVAPVSWIANLIVSRTAGGYESLGVIGAVGTIMSIVLYLPTVLLSPALSILSNASQDRAQLRQTIRHCLSLASFSALPIAIVIAVLGKWVLIGLYGQKYSHAAISLQWAMIVVGIQATGSSLGNLLQATGRMWWALVINGAWGAGFLLLALALVPRYGSPGYFAAMAISYMAIAIVIYTAFYFTEPWMTGGYPLMRLLAVYCALAVGIMYTAPHFTLAASVPMALAAGGAMAIGVVLISGGWQALTSARRPTTASTSSIIDPTAAGA